MACAHSGNVQSAPAPRNAVCQLCRWLSTNPGMTIRSVASITSASGASIRAATSTITPSSISTSPWTRSGTAGSMVSTVPPVSRVFMGGTPYVSVGGLKQ